MQTHLFYFIKTCKHNFFYFIKTCKHNFFTLLKNANLPFYFIKKCLLTFFVFRSIKIPQFRNFHLNLNPSPARRLEDGGGGPQPPVLN